ncbi:single-stranded DNA-binding protein (plasmid) [Vreelandella sp. SM1641]|uniref:Single-stranded DNA-binding protein n=1 Tax=Vreelandella sp. SM1641 TaxID=3126101 RepID=A0AAU7XWI3_9GAMM
MWGQTLQIGHIGEPEVRTNGNGKTYVRFGINMAKKVGDDPMWLNCILGGRFAEVMKDRLKRGQLVFVEGELSFRKADNGLPTEPTQYAHKISLRARHRNTYSLLRLIRRNQI